MTLLQMAREGADHPGLAASDLKQERLASGVADGELDLVVESSRKEGTNAYLIPRVRLTARTASASCWQMLSLDISITCSTCLMQPRKSYCRPGAQPVLPSQNRVGQAAAVPASLAKMG
jgi:hypothetical protein